LLSSIALEVAAGRGEADALVGAEWLRAWWCKDGLIAITSGGAMIELLGQRGNVAAAQELYDDVVETVTRIWGSRDFQARIRLAALLVGQYASAAGHAGAADRIELASRGAEVAKDALRIANVAETDRPLGPESAAWVARLIAEEGRLRWLSGADPLGLDEVVARWEVAAASFDELGQLYEAARSRARLAAVLQASGRGGEATAEAGKARDVAPHLGAQRLLEELQLLGDSDRVTARSDPAALTPRETEVLALVAEGRSNREIAQQLFISAKTVSVHVSNVLAKLHAAGRTEAVALARRRGLLPEN
jgi:DNA-binding CsgD family transcriptional regulator